MEAIIPVEGFWAKCWRQASEAVYGIKAQAMKVVYHAKATAKAGWSWMASTTSALAKRVKISWEILKARTVRFSSDISLAFRQLANIYKAAVIDAVKAYAAVAILVKDFLTWEAVRVSFAVAKAYNWVKDSLTQAAEEAVTVIMKIAMYSAIWLKVVVARLRTAVEVVWNHRKLAAVGAIAYSLAGLGVPFAGTIASIVIIGLLVLIDATVLAHSLQAEYVHYYHPQVAAAA